MNTLLSLNIHGYRIIIIFWNIFLLLIPCFLVYFADASLCGKKWADMKRADKIAFALIFLVWLFFLPNTAYLLTEPRHLVDYCQNWDKYRVCAEKSWIVMFFAAYSAMGVSAFYFALNKMSELEGRLFSGKIRRALPVVTIPIVSVGVMLGLINRFNSWEAVTNPASVARAAFGYFTDGQLFLNFLVFTALLYFVYYGIGFFIKRVH